MDRDEPSIEQMAVALRAAGWLPETPSRWRSPSGALYLGPYGAWKAMTGIGDGGKYAELRESIVTRRP